MVVCPSDLQLPVVAVELVAVNGNQAPATTWLLQALPVENLFDFEPILDHVEFDDGTFFYPIGPCLRSPSDTRIPYPDVKWNVGEISRMTRVPINPVRSRVRLAKERLKSRIESDPVMMEALGR